jgi:inorganic triphosphatase YgiF
VSSRVRAEREAVLLVTSRQSERTARRLAALRRLGSYTLRPRGVVAIVDTYFDTPDGQIGTRHAALRTRRKGKRLLVTLKAPSSRRGMVQDRSELELPLGIRSAGTVLRRLRRLGVRGFLPSPYELSRLVHGARTDSSPLVPTQRRSTRRLLRDAMRRDGGRDHRVAEISLDRVAYGRGLGVRLREVEIETKDSGSAGDVEAIARALLRGFPRELRVWKHSKLAVGMALQRLQERGRLDRLLTRRRELRPAAIPRVLRELRSR